MFLNRLHIIICIVVLFCMLSLFSGCDEVRDYKRLSYFFDGVPLPEAERLALEEQARLNDPNGVAAGLKGEPKKIWYTHEPYKSCDPLCHGIRKRGGYSGSVKMALEPPQLCIQCHEDKDYSATPVPVHGPVAVGECLYCHAPHKSTNKHLLKMSAPELCFQCHNPLDIRLIKGHQEFTNCFKCHYGHTSPDKFLLRQGRSPESN